MINCVRWNGMNGGSCVIFRQSQKNPRTMAIRGPLRIVAGGGSYNGGPLLIMQK